MCAYVRLGVYGCAHVRTYVRSWAWLCMAGSDCAWLCMARQGWPVHCWALLCMAGAGLCRAVVEGEQGWGKAYVRSLRAQDFLIIVVRVPFGRDVNGGILAIPTRKRLFATHEKAEDEP